MIGEPIMKLHLSESPSLISIGDDDMGNNDNMIDHTIGRLAGWQAATQQMREQTRTTNGVVLGLRFGISVRNGNGNGDNGYEGRLGTFPTTTVPIPPCIHRGGQP